MILLAALLTIDYTGSYDQIGRLIRMRIHIDTNIHLHTIDVYALVSYL